jgi:hypothetical protein
MHQTGFHYKDYQDKRTAKKYFFFYFILILIRCILILHIQQSNKCTILINYKYILQLLHVSTCVRHHRGAFFVCPVNINMCIVVVYAEKFLHSASVVNKTLKYQQ